MSEYGLPSARDSDGELQAVEHSYTFDGQEITIVLLPPTVSQFEEFEAMAADADPDPDELEQIIRRHIVKPEIPADESLTFREIRGYAEGIRTHAQGGAGVNEEILEELEDIQGEAGN